MMKIGFPIQSARFAFVLAFGILFIAGTLAHVPYVNGPWYWNWAWRDLSFFRVAAYLGLPLIPYAIAVYLTGRPNAMGRAALIITVGLLCLANFLFQVMGIASDPRSLGVIKDIVLSDGVTSYFGDALKIRDLTDWLRNFHVLNLGFHSSTHPPGPMLFYYLVIKFFGERYGAYIGAYSIGLLASFSIILLFIFAGLWTRDVKTRLTICAYYAVTPGSTLFFPVFDQIYPLFTMLMILFWERALRKAPYYGLAMGAVLFLTTFFTYKLLVVGAFLMLSSLCFMSEEGSWQPKAIRILMVSGMALVVWFGFHLVLYSTVEFHPLLSFQRALLAQKYNLGYITRPYRYCLIFDVYQFFLGAGMIAVPILILFFKRTIKHLGSREYSLVLSYICLATILTADISGLLTAEATRLWLFLLPLLTIPVGLEFARFSLYQQRVLYFTLWLSVVAIKSNMWFIAA